MRIWDIAPDKMCSQHLLGEHRELHAIWSILTQGKKGYAKHPETLRWHGKLKALYARHQVLAEEMANRGYTHKSPLSEALATGSSTQDKFVNTREEQIRILRNKKCDCYVYTQKTRQ